MYTYNEDASFHELPFKTLQKFLKWFELSRLHPIFCWGTLDRGDHPRRGRRRGGEGEGRREEETGRDGGRREGGRDRGKEGQREGGRDERKKVEREEEMCIVLQTYIQTIRMYIVCTLHIYAYKCT